MKSVKLLILLFAAAALMLSGCDKAEDKGKENEEFIAGDGAYRESFVEAYIFVEKIMLQAIDGGIELHTNGNSVWHNQDSPEYQQLSEYYGDTYFNSKIAIFGDIVIADEVQSIDVTSSVDFNDHPAGESLRDIVQIDYRTAWPFIKSGYTDRGDDGGYHIIVMPLSEVTPVDLKMMKEWPTYLRFTETPAIKQHTFTVTMTGRDPLAAVDTPPLVWSDTVDVTFE